MFRLAYRQLTHDRFRSLLTVLAIACSISVILILRGFEQGLYVQSANVVLNRGGQLFVTQAGVSNFFVVRSSLHQLTRERVESIQGVDDAHPVTGLWVIHGPDGNKMPLFLMVYDPPGHGGPARLIKGNHASGGKDVVLDIGFTRHFQLDVGDSLTISDFEFVVSGITRDESALFSPIGFLTYDGLIDFFLESDSILDISLFPLTSFLILDLSLDADRQSVIHMIEANVPEADVFTPEELAESDRAVGEELFGPIMGALISLSYVIGLLVIGLIIYSDVSSRRQSLGTLKALGFDLFRIGRGVVIQSLLLITLAWPVGLVVADAVKMGIEKSMPVYMVHIMDLEGLVQTFAGVAIITLIGSLLPMRLVARIDPVEALQRSS